MQKHQITNKLRKDDKNLLLIESWFKKFFSKLPGIMPANKDGGKFMSLYRGTEWCLSKASGVGENNFFLNFIFLSFPPLSAWKSVEEKFWFLKCLTVNDLHRGYAWEDHCSELALKNLYPLLFAFSPSLKLKVKNEKKWNDFLIPSLKNQTCQLYPIAVECQLHFHQPTLEVSHLQSIQSRETNAGRWNRTLDLASTGADWNNPSSKDSVEMENKINK